MTEIKTSSRKIRVTGQLRFETAFHLGSGREGELLSDRGVLRDEFGRPVLPGSSIKGKMRATIESLAPHLKLSACLLDTALSGVRCISARHCENKGDELKDELASLQRKTKNAARRLQWIQKHSCDVCRLFGSPGHAGRIFFADGRWQEREEPILVRHGVCLDRDSGIAVPKLKYDFEVVPAGLGFEISIAVDGASAKELGMLWAGVSEWRDSVRLGGMRTRGLGLAKLHDVALAEVDLSKPVQRREWLLNRKWTAVDTKTLDDMLEELLIEAE
jgi:CRISPR-associated protein Csm3